MLIDANVGGPLDGTSGGSIAELGEQFAEVAEVGYDGVWTTEVGRDPFLPLLLAAEHLEQVTIGSSIAVAFARNPMSLATTANDLQSFSGGRFVLGLGSQIKAHIERRYSMPWSKPAARMEEFVRALRAIWSAWDNGERLRFEGDFYRHTLMTPMFTPERHQWGPPPILLAAVGPAMTRTAARVADGLIVHSFTTATYLSEATLPRVETDLADAGRTRAGFTVSLPGLVVTGGSDHELESAAADVRGQIAFYGATPAYREVLDCHGWGDLHEKLHRLSVRGEWQTMAGLIDDEVLSTFAVVGAPEEAGAEAVRRFGGLVDRFTFYAPYATSVDVRRRFVAGARAASASTGSGHQDRGDDQADGDDCGHG